MANKKISQLTETTTVSPSDILPIVINPATTPASRYITAGNLMTALNTGWQLLASSGTYASATTFTIAGNLTGYLNVGTRIKLTNSTVKYFYVYSATYSAPNTTVTLFTSTSYSLTNTTISNIFISYGSPADFPTLMNYTPVLSVASGTLTSASASGTFAINGRLLALNLAITITTNGTASGAIYATIPKPPAIVTIINGRENAITGSMLQGFLDGNTTMSIFKYDGGYPSGNGYQIYMSGTYAI